MNYCPQCGEPFVGGVTSQVYCCVTCKLAARNARKRDKRKTEGTGERQGQWRISSTYVYSDVKTWRARVTEKWGGQCADCGTAEGPMHAHHIIPKGAGGRNTIVNGVLLCEECHQKRHLGLAPDEELVERVAERVFEKLLPYVQSTSTPPPTHPPPWRPLWPVGALT